LYIFAHFFCIEFVYIYIYIYIYICQQSVVCHSTCNFTASTTLVCWAFAGIRISVKHHARTSASHSDSHCQGSVDAIMRSPSEQQGRQQFLRVATLDHVWLHTAHNCNHCCLAMLSLRFVGNVNPISASRWIYARRRGVVHACTTASQSTASATAAWVAAEAVRRRARDEYQ